ncbi:MAG: hypothetical protein J7501_13925 [Bdellovibrio sp.]|nr:hypothetical protein [Bdellovibrio sp.]
MNIRFLNEKDAHASDEDVMNDASEVVGRVRTSDQWIWNFECKQTDARLR